VKEKGKEGFCSLRRPIVLLRGGSRGEGDEGSAATLSRRSASYRKGTLMEGARQPGDER